MPDNTAIIKKVEITSIGEDVEKMCTFSYTVGKNGNGCSHRGKWYRNFSKKKKKEQHYHMSQLFHFWAFI